MPVYLGFHEKKTPFGQKRPQKSKFLKKSQNIDIIFSPEALTLLRYKYCKTEEKNWPRSTKKVFFSKIFKKVFFCKDFLDFLLFCLILGLSPHIHIFFQLSSCTGWSTIKDIQIFQNTVFLPFFGPLPFSWGVFFDKISSPTLVPYCQ